jgi:hypothetical protein
VRPTHQVKRDRGRRPRRGNPARPAQRRPVGRHPRQPASVTPARVRVQPRGPRHRQYGGRLPRWSPWRSCWPVGGTVDSARSTSFVRGRVDRELPDPTVVAVRHQSVVAWGSVQARNSSLRVAGGCRSRAAAHSVGEPPAVSTSTTVCQRMLRSRSISAAPSPTRPDRERSARITAPQRGRHPSGNADRHPRPGTRHRHPAPPRSRHTGRSRLPRRAR